MKPKYLVILGDQVKGSLPLTARAFAREMCERDEGLST